MACVLIWPLLQLQLVSFCSFQVPSIYFIFLISCHNYGLCREFGKNVANTRLKGGSPRQLQNYKKNYYNITKMEGGHNSLSASNKIKVHHCIHIFHTLSTRSQGVKEQVYRVPGGQGAGLQGPRGSRGRLRGSQGVGFMNRYCQDYMLSENTWFSCPKSSNN